MPKKQKSGLYRTKIKIGVDAQGKDINKWVSGRTMAELETAKQEARAYYIDGAPQRDVLFGAYAVEWFKVKRLPRIKAGTAEVYRTLMNTHILPAFGDRQMRAISAHDVQAWLDGFKGASASQIDKLYMLIRAIFQSAYAAGVVSRDPTAGLAKPIPRKKKSRRALTASETEAILTTMRRHEDGLFLAILYYLGLRRGEALGLQAQDFDFASGMVHIERDIVYVRGKTVISDLKSDAADRYVLLPEPLMALLRPVCASLAGDAWLISSGAGNPLCMSAYKRMWTLLMLDAGLVEAKEPTDAVKRKLDSRPDRVEPMDLYQPTITAHYLRHNYITKLFYAGLDPVLTMWIVGHESYETTVDIYTHLRKSRFQEFPTDMQWVYDLKKEARKIQTPEQIIPETNP